MNHSSLSFHLCVAFTSREIFGMGKELPLLNEKKDH